MYRYNCNDGSFRSGLVFSLLLLAKLVVPGIGSVSEVVITWLALQWDEPFSSTICNQERIVRSVIAIRKSPRLERRRKVGG